LEEGLQKLVTVRKVPKCGS